MSALDISASRAFISVHLGAPGGLLRLHLGASLGFPGFHLRRPGGLFGFHQFKGFADVLLEIVRQVGIDNTTCQRDDAQPEQDGQNPLITFFVRLRMALFFDVTVCLCIRCTASA